METRPLPINEYLGHYGWPSDGAIRKYNCKRGDILSALDLLVPFKMGKLHAQQFSTNRRQKCFPIYFICLRRWRILFSTFVPKAILLFVRLQCFCHYPNARPSKIGMQNRKIKNTFKFSYSVFFLQNGYSCESNSQLKCKVDVTIAF